jgi:mycothiol synthase
MVGKRPEMPARPGATVADMANVVLRPMRRDDVAEICALTNRAHEHDEIPQVLDETELAQDLDRLDLATDTRVAEVDGRAGGYAYVWYKPSGARLERAHIFGTVDPPARGVGVGRALMEWGTDRARESLLSAANSLPKYVRVEAYEQVEGAQRLFERLGFTHARWFEELLRPLDDVPPSSVAEGYEIVSWPRERAEELLAVRNEAFADHWGSTSWTREIYDEVTEGYGSRLDLSVAAVDVASGEIAAVCINQHFPLDAATLGRTDGWIGVLGTRAAHRGRGLASSLINESLRRFAEAGFTHASIGVDAASPTGANLLYRRLGFQPEQRHITYQIEL